MWFFGKRGELTSRQIVLIVMVVAGLIIGIVFFTVLFEEKPTKELCRLSVIERASLPAGKDAVPLKCTTEKICITTSKRNKCKEFAGEDDVRYVTLKVPTGTSEKDIAKREKAIEKIEEENANAMFDCWRMTGEGKLDIFGGESGVVGNIAQSALGSLSLQQVNPKCIVCSRVAISEDLKKKNEDVLKNKGKFLDDVDVNDYMVRHKVPGSTLTYLQTFTDESVGGYAEFSKEEGESSKNNDMIKLGVSQLAMVFVQIKVPNAVPETEYWKALGTGALIGAGAALTGPGGLVTKVVARSAFPLGLLVEAGTIAVGSHVYASKVEANVRGNQLMAAATCGEYNTNQGEKKGCSLVKAMPWDAKSINNLCRGGIESNF